MLHNDIICLDFYYRGHWHGRVAIQMLHNDIICLHFYYRGHWHGRVAIKMLHMDSDTDNKSQLEAFKQEVGIL